MVDQELTPRLTEARGFECASHHLVMFGGAGGQHACSIASTLNIVRIIIPRYSSILSAYGMALADVVVESTEPAAFTLSAKDLPDIQRRQDALIAKAQDDLRSQGYPDDRIECEAYLNCRYQGTSTQLMIERPTASAKQDDDQNGGDEGYQQKFYDEHKREFGFNLEGRDVIVDDLRVRAVGKSLGGEVRNPYEDYENAEKRQAGGKWETKEVYFEQGGWLQTGVVPLEKLQSGEQIVVSRLSIEAAWGWAGARVALMRRDRRSFSTQHKRCWSNRGIPRPRWLSMS